MIQGELKKIDFGILGEMADGYPVIGQDFSKGR